MENDRMLKATWFGSISNGLLVIVGIFGLYYVVCELRELGKQNEYLERTLRQSYLPLGTVRYSEDEGIGITLGFVISDSQKDKYELSYAPQILNAGKGLMKYIGAISYLWDDTISLRGKLLDGGKSLDFKIDNMFHYLRRTPVLPGKSYGNFRFKWENVKHNMRYYLYTLLFYEDQDGRLYDTERLDVLFFLTPESHPIGLYPVLDTTKYQFFESYHLYTDIEKAALHKVFASKNHPLQYIIN